MTKQYRIDPGKLGEAKGRLEGQLGRVMTWEEFAAMCDLNPHTMSNIYKSITAGSIPTAEKIVAVLRHHGIPWTLADFER